MNRSETAGHGPVIVGSPRPCESRGVVTPLGSDVPGGTRRAGGSFDPKARRKQRGWGRPTAV